MECISRAKKHFSKTWQEKLVDPTWNSVRRILSTSLLEGSESSDAAHPDCENRTVVWFWIQLAIDVPVLGLAGGHWRQNENWKIAGTSGWSVPISQSQTTVFVGQWMEWDSLPPCWERICAKEPYRNRGLKLKQKETWSNKQTSSGRSFTSFQMFHTHTHTRQEWIIIWSGRNWILKHANLILNSVHVHDLQQNMPNTSAT